MRLIIGAILLPLLHFAPASAQNELKEAVATNIGEQFAELVKLSDKIWS